MNRFVLFGTAHLVAISLIALVAAGLVAWARARPGVSKALQRSLGTALLALMALALFWARRRGESWSSLAPLQLCDLAIFIGAWALFTRQPLACELTYFWGAAGTTLAVLTPDLVVGFPDPEFISYFALHGVVIAAAVLLPFGLGRAPRRGAVRRVWLLTNLYALAVAVVDVAFDTNFLYLRAKPAGHTPLDWFGPWPWYLLACEGVALALFWALALPFRGTRRESG